MLFVIKNNFNKWWYKWWKS